MHDRRETVGCIGYLGDVVLEGTEVDVKIPLIAGGTLTGSIEKLTVSFERLFVLVSTGEGFHALHRHGKIAADGSFHVDGLPPGPLHAKVVLKRDGQKNVPGKSVACRAGETITLLVPTRRGSDAPR